MSQSCVKAVLHFMRAQQIRKTLNILHTSLRAGGKIYNTVILPYIKCFIEPFQTNLANGCEWPGYFEEPEALSPLLKYAHKPFNAIDEETLPRELRHAGFDILESRYIKNPFFKEGFRHGDRDWVIAIAKKKNEPR